MKTTTKSPLKDVWPMKDVGNKWEVTNLLPWKIISFLYNYGLK